MAVTATSDGFFPSLPTLGILSLILYLTYKWLSGGRKKSGDPNLLEVPMVKGGLPFFGHALTMGKDMLKFASNCVESHGKIFKFKLFRMTVVLIADRVLAQEYYKSKDDTLGAIELLIDISFFDAVCPSLTVENSPHYLDLVRKTNLGSKYENLVPKLNLTCEQFVATIKGKILQNTDVSLVDECMAWGTKAMAYCTTGLQFNDVQVAKVTHLGKALEKMMILAAFLPRWARKLIMQGKLDRMRTEIATFIYPAIKAHRQDPTLKDSEYIRLALDMTENGVYSFTDEEIADACLLSITADVNVGMGVNCTIFELATRKELWKKLKDELSPLMKSGAMVDILKNSFLNGVILETARTNPKLMLTSRKPAKGKSVSLGPYDVSDADMVAICIPAFHLLEPASETYADKEKFDPERFLRKEPASPPALNTWGGGAHRCPGKNLSVAMMKIAVAHFIVNFDIEYDLDGKVVMDYNGLTAYPKKVLPKCQIVLAK